MMHFQVCYRTDDTLNHPPIWVRDAEEALAVMRARATAGEHSYVYAYPWKRAWFPQHTFNTEAELESYIAENQSVEK